MAITEAFTFQEAISTTEWSCTTDSAGPAANTTDGVFQLYMDLNDMIAGDQLQIRLYEKIVSGGTQRLIQEWILTGAQGSVGWSSPPFILLHGWDFTLDALAGTITIDWSIRKVG